LLVSGTKEVADPNHMHLMDTSMQIVRKHICFKLIV